ncbi:MAG: homoserine kinase [Alphaproteobacteria bacterium]|nr:MAG: homoserine kinase [Alphaproteobacteria bacterium]
MAVFTHVEEEELEAFLKDYDLGDIQAFKGIAEGVQNTNYLLTTTKGAYILTLYEPGIDKTELPFFLDLMDHLSKNGLACPVPIKTRNGDELGELCGRPAALVSFLNGVSVGRPTAHHCAEVGRGLAQMHNAVVDFPGKRANSLAHEGWRSLADTCLEAADEIEPGLANLITNELKYLDDNWPEGLPEGVIHADLFPDNVFFLGNDLSGLIDFYFACNDTFIYDLAICMNAWCFERDGSFNATKARRMTAAYGMERPYTEDEIHALPILARGAALRFLLTRLYDSINQVEGAMVETKNPMEYAKKLQFHQRVKNAGEYGLG